MKYTVGIDLGGSSVKAVAVSLDGEILARRMAAFSVAASLDWAVRIRDLFAELQTERGEPAEYVGLSAPGLAAADGRSIAFMPGRLEGLENLDWTRFLGVSQPVLVLNDAQAALVGESWIGAARGFQNVIMLTLGTGVGGAAIVDGRLLRGNIGRAGHLGHICLNPDGPADVAQTPGSLEMVMGNCTVEARSRGRFHTTHDLVTAHLAGDTDATKVWLESVRNLACAICSLINILDPAAVIIGGGIARAGAALLRPLAEYLDPIEWRPGGSRVTLLPATLGEYAGACGAARNAMAKV